MLRLIYFGITFFWLWLPQLAMAQGYPGRVVDPDGAAIPEVQVLLPDGQPLLLTDSLGRFTWPQTTEATTLTFRHPSYLETVIDLRMDEVPPAQVVLSARDYALAEVEIIGDSKDPAYAIIRQTIDNKRETRAELEAYACLSYVKMKLIADTTFVGRRRPKPKARDNEADSLAADSAVVDTVPPGPKLRNLVEMQAQTYFQAPASRKMVVQAYRDYHQNASAIQSFAADNPTQDYRTDFDNPYLFLPDPPGTEFNLYSNLIEARDLGDRPYISPLHSTLWQMIYRYRLVDRHYVDGQVIFEIDFEPKNEIGPYFAGTLWIVNGEWAIQHLELEIMPSNLNYFRSFRFEHFFDRHPSTGLWLLQEERYDYEIKEGSELLIGSTLARHQDYELSQTFPRNFFRNELIRTDQEAFERDSSFWSGLNRELDAQELGFMEEQDSIQAYYSTPEYLRQQDSIFNHLKIKDFLWEGVSWRNRARGMIFWVDPIASMPQPLGVGGYRHRIGGAVRKTWNRAHALTLRGSADYGVVNRDLKGQVRANYLYNPRKLASVRVGFGDRYNLITTQESFVAILSRGNFVREIYGSLGHRRELINGLYLNVSTQYTDRQAISDLQLSNWSQELFGENNAPRTFDPFREFIVNVELTFTPFQPYYLEPFRKVVMASNWPTFSLEWRKAIPGLFGSTINFDRLTLSAEQEFFPGSLGIMRWRAVAGRFLNSNNLLFTDYRFFRGSDLWFFANPLQAFQLLGPTLSTKNAYLEGHFLHDFSGGLIDKVPLLKRTDLQIAVGASALVMEDGNFFHSEVFAGMAYPFRIREVRFKIGAYYVTAFSNHENALTGQLKFGITFFDSQKNRWQY